MKKLLSVSFFVATGLLLGTQAQAAEHQAVQPANQQGDRTVSGDEGLYANFGAGLTHKNEIGKTAFSWNVGLGKLYPLQIHTPAGLSWGWESNLEMLGNDVYGLNGDGVLAYQIMPKVLAFGKLGVLVAHADSLHAGIQFGEGVGYQITENIRTSLEFMHTFSVQDGMTSYLLSTQIRLPSLFS